MSNTRDDWFIKFLLTHDLDFLTFFLNSFHTLHLPVAGLMHYPTEQISESNQEKITIVDVCCVDQYGRFFIIEMQKQNFTNFIERIILNANKINSRQLKKGKGYQKLMPVYTLCLVDENIFPEKDSWMHDIFFTRTTAIGAQLGNQSFKIIELKKWRKIGKFDKENPQSYWLTFFTDPLKLKQILKGMTPEEIKKFDKFFDIVSLWDTTQYTEAQLRGYDKYIDELLYTDAIKQEMEKRGLKKGMRKGLSQGREEGLSQGREEGKVEGEKLALEKILLLIEDIKSGLYSNQQLSEKHNVSLEYIQKLKES
jgi:predicted transposase/invertase (TIGR01784 family)